MIAWPVSASSRDRPDITFRPDIGIGIPPPGIRRTRRPTFHEVTDGGDGELQPKPRPGASGSSRYCRELSLGARASTVVLQLVQENAGASGFAWAPMMICVQLSTQMRSVIIKLNSRGSLEGCATALTLRNGRSRGPSTEFQKIDLCHSRRQAEQVRILFAERVTALAACRRCKGLRVEGDSSGDGRLERLVGNPESKAIPTLARTTARCSTQSLAGNLL